MVDEFFEELLPSFVRNYCRVFRGYVGEFCEEVLSSFVEELLSSFVRNCWQVFVRNY